MADVVPSKNKYIEQVIAQRTGTGPNDMVRGWQSMLSNLLNQMAPYLQPSRVVTFRQLTTMEQHIFQRITALVEVPQSAWGVYLSPSARNQMLYTNRNMLIPDSAAVPNDDGVLLLTHTASHETIINGLLAHPPHTPAIDVYQNSALLAGYVFEEIDDCLSSINDVISTFLKHPVGDREANTPRHAHEDE